MREDIRYKAAGLALRCGEITTIQEVCGIIPASVVAKDLAMNYRRFITKMLGSGWPCMFDVVNFARLLDVSPVDLFAAILRDKEREKLRLIELTSKET